MLFFVDSSSKKVCYLQLDGSIVTLPIMYLLTKKKKRKKREKFIYWRYSFGSPCGISVDSPGDTFFVSDLALGRIVRFGLSNNTILQTLLNYNTNFSGKKILK